MSPDYKMPKPEEIDPKLEQDEELNQTDHTDSPGVETEQESPGPPAPVSVDAPVNTSGDKEGIGNKDCVSSKFTIKTPTIITSNKPSSNIIASSQTKDSIRENERAPVQCMTNSLTLGGQDPNRT